MKSQLIGILFSIFCASSASIQANQNTENTTDKLVRQSITPWMQKNHIPGVAVEIYDNGVPHAYYFGYANREKKIPVTHKTIFEVGSFTKLFTSLLLAEEINSGKMKLNDSIEQYIPDLVLANPDLKVITIENLATDTSGLPFSTSDEIKSRSQLKAYFASWHPASPIGSQWRYSNVNTGLLGYALETNTHENLNQLYRKRILQPLRMDPIAITVPKRYAMNYAQGYAEDGKAVPRSRVDSLFPAAGDMKASGHDMLLFLKAAVGLSGVQTDVAKAMLTTQKAYVSTTEMKQGLAWIITPDVQKNRKILLTPSANMNKGPLPAQQLNKNEQLFYKDALIDKTGGTQGFRTYIAVIPNQKSGIVVMANKALSSGEIIKIGRRILLNLDINYSAQD